MATAWSPAEPKPLRASPTQDPAITVFLADDNLLVREGARALLALQPDLQVIWDGRRLRRADPRGRGGRAQVIMTDIRMPPAFQREGIDAARAR
jgi:adenylate cyclase